MTPAHVLREAARRIAEGESEFIYCDSNEANNFFFDLLGGDYGRSSDSQGHRVLALLLAAEVWESEHPTRRRK